MPADAAAKLPEIEHIKARKDGLDVLADIYRYAGSPGLDIDPDDLERMKWYGLFHRKATPGLRPEALSASAYWRSASSFFPLRS